MKLVGVTLKHVGPFEHIDLPFCDESGEPRALTVVHGAGGVGKTTLVAAIAATRPGHATVPPRELVVAVPAGDSAQIACSWRLGADDRERPHPLVVATPTTALLADPEAEVLRRREQALFDRLAREQGFVFVGLPSTRWFSRQAVSVAAPARTVLEYDVRAATGFGDTARADLARETKQALVYAGLAASLPPPPGTDSRRLQLFEQALRGALEPLLSLVGIRYWGIDPWSLEPLFMGGGARLVSFDALPTRARHLASFAVLPARALFAAYPLHDPRHSEGVVAIDEADLYLDPGVQAGLPAALRAALPGVQWILTATAPRLAGSCDTRDVLALRRQDDRGQVELFAGLEARIH